MPEFNLPLQNNLLSYVSFPQHQSDMLTLLLRRCAMLPSKISLSACKPRPEHYLGAVLLSFRVVNTRDGPFQC